MYDSSELIATSPLARVLNVSTRTIDRWRKDERVGFPAPTVINGRKYWPTVEVRAWRERMAARSRKDAQENAA
jgi:predicted DNA-binding transcriptional regulator AlpA